MEITIKDIILAASGKKDNHTKSNIGLFHELWNKDGETVNRIQEISLDKPVVNISKHSGFILVDLEFVTHLDADFRQCYHMLNKFFSAESSEDDNAEDVPVLVLSIIPHEYDGSYYFLALNPVLWTITPSAPSEEHANVIRMVFTEDNFNCYQSENEIDITEIKEEAKAEVEKQYSEFEPHEE